MHLSRETEGGEEGEEEEEKEEGSHLERSSLKIITRRRRHRQFAFVTMKDGKFAMSMPEG